MTPPQPLVTVCVMAFNEAENLPPVVQEIHTVLAGLGQPFELLLIDDGSTDETGRLADQLAEQMPETRVVHHLKNQGLGGVYRTGFAEARGVFFTFFPADGQFPANLIPRFLALAQDRDLILGYLPGRRASPAALFLSGVERLIYRLMFGTLPRFQGILMCRRSILSRIPLKSTGRSWVVVMELILRAARQRFRLRSEPGTYRPRLSGESKVNNWRTIKDHLRDLKELHRVL